MSVAAAAVLAAGVVAVPVVQALADPAAAPTSVSPIAAGQQVGVGGLRLTLDVAPAPASTRIRSSAGTPVEPVPPSQCQQVYGSPGCYGPPQINAAYGLDRLHRRGLVGAGRTVVIPICAHNPHIRRDVAVYSRHWGLPAAEVEVVKHGDVPTADPDNPEQALCATEATVDVQAVHATAPGAKIIVVETARIPSGGTKGLRELINAIGWVTQHRQVDAVTMSWGAYEAHFPEQAGRAGDYRLLTALRGPLRAAYRRGTTLIAASGNTGPTGPNLAGTAFYSRPTVAWPASDPMVTAVGGTRVHLDDHGHRIRPDDVWGDESGHATGAGLSAVFPRPAFQRRVAGVVGARRGVVDLALNASGQAREWYYSGGYNPLPGQQPGWLRVAGTSIAAPKVAGIVAIAAQQAGRPLGDIHQALYAAPGSLRHGLYDLTTGSNTANGVPGFSAGQGYDPPSGAGTVVGADRLVAALARAAADQPRTR
ncbi:S53 family peptidase [Actinomadura sp. KC216]|uniref:S53 family peptidase n=1 Tax=Actinomadura sp. KC216 TaxID=2530370 RepID=UPI0014043CE8|nr:S53 family peptidase [Actinomadura sp. KC216]